MLEIPRELSMVDKINLVAVAIIGIILLIISFGCRFGSPSTCSGQIVPDFIVVILPLTAALSIGFAAVISMGVR